MVDDRSRLAATDLQSPTNSRLAVVVAPVQLATADIADSCHFRRAVVDVEDVLAVATTQPSPSDPPDHVGLGDLQVEQSIVVTA
jgi:hypothetical protein